MTACPHCLETIKDNATKCKHCGAWLDSTAAERSPHDDRMVLVLDRGLVRYAKFSLSVLAIFLVVGAFFYGIDLRQSADELEEIRDDFVEARDALEPLLARFERVSQQLNAAAEEAQAYHSEIVGLRSRAAAAVQSIEGQRPDRRALDQSIRTVVRDVLREVFPAQAGSPALRPSQPGQFTLDAIREQPALTFLTATRTPVAPQTDDVVLVALLAEASEIPPIQLQDRVVYGWPVGGQSTPGLGDDVAHATAVAAVIAAVAPTAEILPIRVLGGTGGLADIEAGLRVARERQADIIVMPFGVNLEATENAPQAAIDELLSNAAGAGALLVAPAGNTGSELVQYPASHTNVLSVGSLDAGGEPAPFSAFGAGVDLFAPGVNISSLDPLGNEIRLSGGSLSAAIVAGLAGLAAAGTTPRPRFSDLGDILIETSDRARIDWQATTAALGIL